MGAESSTLLEYPPIKSPGRLYNLTTRTGSPVMIRRNVASPIRPTLEIVTLRERPSRTRSGIPTTEGQSNGVPPLHKKSISVPSKGVPKSESLKLVYEVHDNVSNMECYKKITTQISGTSVAIKSLGDYPKLKRLFFWFKNIFSRFTRRTYSTTLNLQEKIEIARKLNQPTKVVHLREKRAQVVKRWKACCKKASSLGRGLRYKVRSTHQGRVKTYHAKPLTENYWCEFLGLNLDGEIRHIYLNKMRPYFDEWQKDNCATDNFEAWMEKRFKKLSDEDQAKILKSSVEYLDNRSRYQKEVSVTTKGRLLDANGTHLAQGRYIFGLAIDDSNKAKPRFQLCIGKKVRGQFQHSSFFQGRPLQAAGIIELDSAGQISFFNGHSGHYKPGKSENELFLHFLAQHIDSDTMTNITHSTHSQFVIHLAERLQKYKLVRKLVSGFRKQKER